MTPGVEQRQRQRVAAVERQIAHAAVLDNGAERRASGVDQRSFRLNLNRFGNLTDIESDVDLRVLTYLEPDARADSALESCSARANGVLADR